MRGSFFEYNVAMAGLFTAKGALNVVSHNMANASTKGYSRQYAELRATKPLSLGTGKGMIGTGSELYGVAQVRNFYLDKKLWTNMATLGQYSVKRTQLTITQAVFNEMSETGTGFTSQLDAFFERIQDLITNAGDSTYRNNVIQQADALGVYIKSTYEALQQQQRDINTEVSATVQIINTLGQEIVTLNKQITQLEFSGNIANDLRDQRALLVDELSRYVNVEVNEFEMNEAYASGNYPNADDRDKSEKQFVVLINGQQFIDHYEMRSLECRQRTAADGTTGLYVNPEDVNGLYDIYFKNSLAKFDVYSPSLSGELKALIDIRDGNNGNGVKSSAIDYSDFGTNNNIFSFDVDPETFRVDILEMGGILKLTNNTTGLTSEYNYTDCNVTYERDPVTGAITNVNVRLTMENELPQTVLNGTAGSFTAAISETSTYKGIPYYLSKINECVRTLSSAMNFGTDLKGYALKGVTGHVDGVDAYGQEANTLFFTYMLLDGEAENDGNFNIYKTTGLNFMVNSSLLADPKLMVTAPRVDSESGESDNNLAFGFLSIQSNKSLFREGTINDFTNAIAGELGIDLRQAINFENNYTDVTSAIDYQRMSVSSVSLDEEMANMIRFQQQYNAAAKLINVIDGIYDTLINRLGAF